AALTEAEERLQGDAGEARRALEDATMSLEGLQPDEELRARANELRDMVGQLRVELTEARARHESMKREAEARSRRLAGIIDERRAWELRSTNAERQIATLEERQAEGMTELQELEAVPALVEERRIGLLE